ncbi:MAG TPA: hypothetical protein VLM37_05165 [Fibrobacteraceae bacterium]|nr:hypothetical protein [Fibrobacteraceae bacterium]
MHHLQFRCPHCQNNVDLSLESEATVIVMSCSHCKTPLMYYYGEVFEVDNIEMTDLQQKQLRAVQGYMSVRGVHQQVTSTETLAGTHPAGQPVRDTAISQDDITDLMIDLGLSNDVDEFLRRLG